MGCSTREENDGNADDDGNSDGGDAERNGPSHADRLSWKLALNGFDAERGVLRAAHRSLDFGVSRPGISTAVKASGAMDPAPGAQAAL